jgi:hypothetical protein
VESFNKYTAPVLCTHPTQTPPFEESLPRANTTGSARRERRGLRLMMSLHTQNNRSGFLKLRALTPSLQKEAVKQKRVQ